MSENHRGRIRAFPTRRVEGRPSNKKALRASLAAIVTCAIVCFLSFRDHAIARGVIALLQVLLFGSAWLMGMQIVKEKIPRLHLVAAGMGFLLILAFFWAAPPSETHPKELVWPSNGIAAVLPEPQVISHKGEVYDFGNSVSIQIEDVSEAEFNAYVESCIEQGFDVEAEQATKEYTAFNQDGYKLALSWHSDKMIIDLEAPIEMGELKWPSGPVGQMVPKPQSDTGTIIRESTNGFFAYVGNTDIDQFNAYADTCSDAGFNVDYERDKTYYRGDNADGYHISISYQGFTTMSVEADAPKEASQESQAKPEQQSEEPAGANSEQPSASEQDNSDKASAQKSSGDELRPEFKEAMDGYEQFYDEYIDFLKTYEEDPTNMEPIAKSADLATQALEVDKKFAAWEGEYLYDAELKYYAEVNLRVEQKLLAAM